MMNSRRNCTLAMVFGITLSIGNAGAQHVGDVWVGRTAAGQLDVGGFADAGVGKYLAPSSGLFPGWSDNDPGFDRLITDDPDNDLFMLAAGAQIRLEVVAFDPAFRAVDTSFNLLDMPGEQTLLGTSSLHTHLTWNINVNDPQFDPDEYLWEATFRLLDTGATGYAPSNDVTLKFTNVDVLPGDVNGDDMVDMLDISGFIALLFDDTLATREQWAAADLNLDRALDGLDLQQFVAMLLVSE